jgi:hypothetical protein
VTQLPVPGAHDVDASAVPPSEFAAHVPLLQISLAEQPTASHPEPSLGHTSAISFVTHFCALGGHPAAPPPSEAQTPLLHVSPAAHAAASHPEPSDGQIRTTVSSRQAFAFGGQPGAVASSASPASPDGDPASPPALPASLLQPQNAARPVTAIAVQRACLRLSIT